MVMPCLLPYKNGDAFPQRNAIVLFQQQPYCLLLLGKGAPAFYYPGNYHA